MLPLAELFPILAEQYSDVPEVQQGMIRIAWNHCVGAALRHISEPASFRDGVLRVRVSHAQWKTTLAPMRQEIISKINRYLKRPLLTRIEIEVTHH